MASLKRVFWRVSGVLAVRSLHRRRSDTGQDPKAKNIFFWFGERFVQKSGGSKRGSSVRVGSLKFEGIASLKIERHTFSKKRLD
jgi:hypothetical protein